MISIREKVVTTLSDLTEIQLRQVAEYLEFLKFRERQREDAQFDDPELEALYAEFADEDRKLAEVGLAEYAATLESEDKAAIKEVIAKDQSTPEQFALLALAEKLSSVITVEYLEERAKRAKLEKFEQLSVKSSSLACWGVEYFYELSRRYHH